MEIECDNCGIELGEIVLDEEDSIADIMVLCMNCGERGFRLQSFSVS